MSELSKLSKIIINQSSQLYTFLECPPGYFGMACSARCFGQCSSNIPCDHVSGMCPGGCQDGYLGRYCNECKSRETLSPFVLTKTYQIYNCVNMGASGKFIFLAHALHHTLLY